MTTRVVDRDRGYKAMTKQVFGMRKPVLEVGILAASAGASYDGGASLLEVATWNEFGTSRIPARSFLRAWFDENSDKARGWLRVGMRRVVKGQWTADQLLHLIGLKIVGEIQARMATSIPPPNAQSTIKKKGSTTTLIDTGQLRSSINYQIKQGT